MQAWVPAWDPHEAELAVPMAVKNSSQPVESAVGRVLVLPLQLVRVLEQGICEQQHCTMAAVVGCFVLLLGRHHG